MTEIAALPSVPFDPELDAALVAMQIPPTITPEMIPLMRKSASATSVSVERLVAGRAIDWAELEIPGAGGTAMRATVFRPRGVTSAVPAVVFAHGGGMIVGDRFTSSGVYLDWVVDLGVMVVAFDYRLAPEDPHPAPVEDCYAALLWTAEHVDDLGIDEERLAIAGASAGGGLAAAVALMARDRHGPRLAAQVLMYSMLDDRLRTPSSVQFRGRGIWDDISNTTGWDSLLGSRRGGPDVSPYAAPAREKNLSDLPPACIDVGSAEGFRDEVVDYAVRMWQAGGVAELHVWPGAWHGFDEYAPHSELAQIARRTRTEWIGRTLRT